MRFSDLLAGTKLRKTIEVDIGLEKPLQIDVRKLEPLETSQVLERAREYAKKRGVEDPRNGDPLYDFALRIHTVAVACVETVSPPEAPRPFFDSADDMLDPSRPILSDDAIAYIYASFELFVDATSLQRRDLSTPEMLRIMTSLEGGDLLPFIKLSPSMQCSSARFMASLALRSPEIRSPSSSPSPITEQTHDEVRRDPGSTEPPAG